MQERANELKEEVRTIIKSATDTFERMNLIDTIGRLGIGYHFEKEINEVLTSLNDAKFGSNNKLIHEVALRFRLLRQHGFHVSADEFLKFKDDKGGFSSIVSEDARGLLSLYNAASLGTDGEDILKEASFFTKERLEYLVHDLEYPLKNQVSRALQIPLPRMMKRLEARWYIDEYKEENPNDIILELATLDFDIVQALHREELRIVSLWWNELNLKENFGYTRDRIVESFFWMTGVYFEPHFSRARIIATKAFNLITLLDDTYDIYGTLEECQLLTDAIQRFLSPVIAAPWENAT
ncbi:alpha-humulene synthase-like protein [Carex littledalei]|uniref:Alpha-humulene synthase-like protein n=1 Tax=Carex littledalei TaxID=544730 RepID=A0A833RUN7_9POAL|nr:alpha-humulene synthase-like protein [Carex littledalei]